MTDQSASLGPTASATGASSLPAAVDRTTFQAELDALRVREKAHTREGDAIAAARRRPPMVEVGASLELIGPHGPVTLLDAFEGRRQLISYYFMWNPGRLTFGFGAVWGCPRRVTPRALCHRAARTLECAASGQGGQL